jgi:hypothetical protein
MKTLKLFPLLASVAIVLSACNAPKTDTATPPVAAVAAPILKNTVDTATAKRMVSNFTPRSGKVQADDANKRDNPDTRCVWFSKEQLQALINKVDTLEGGDGIRFYFAAYDKKLTKGSEHIKKEYWDHSTLLMVSTQANKKDTSDKRHYDYYLNTRKLLNGKYVPDAKHSGAIITAIPENQGELCPPPAKCNTEGATLLEQ